MRLRSIHTPAGVGAAPAQLLAAGAPFAELAAAATSGSCGAGIDLANSTELRHTSGSELAKRAEELEQRTRRILSAPGDAARGDPEPSGSGACGSPDEERMHAAPTTPVMSTGPMVGVGEGENGEEDSSSALPHASPAMPHALPALRSPGLPRFPFPLGSPWVPWSRPQKVDHDRRKPLAQPFEPGWGDSRPSGKRLDRGQTVRFGLADDRDSRRPTWDTPPPIRHVRFRPEPEARPTTICVRAGDGAWSEAPREPEFSMAKLPERDYLTLTASQAVECRSRASSRASSVASSMASSCMSSCLTSCAGSVAASAPGSPRAVQANVAAAIPSGANGGGSGEATGEVTGEATGEAGGVELAPVVWAVTSVAADGASGRKAAELRAERRAKKVAVLEKRTAEARKAAEAIRLGMASQGKAVGAMTDLELAAATPLPPSPRPHRSRRPPPDDPAAAAAATTAAAATAAAPPLAPLASAAALAAPAMATGEALLRAQIDAGGGLADRAAGAHSPPQTPPQPASEAAPSVGSLDDSARPFMQPQCSQDAWASQAAWAFQRPDADAPTGGTISNPEGGGGRQGGLSADHLVTHPAGLPPSGSAAADPATAAMNPAATGSLLGSLPTADATVNATGAAPSPRPLVVLPPAAVPPGAPRAVPALNIPATRRTASSDDLESATPLLMTPMLNTPMLLSRSQGSEPPFEPVNAQPRTGPFGGGGGGAPWWSVSSFCAWLRSAECYEEVGCCLWYGAQRRQRAADAWRAGRQFRIDTLDLLYRHGLIITLCSVIATLIASIATACRVLVEVASLRLAECAKSAGYLLCCCRAPAHGGAAAEGEAATKLVGVAGAT